MSICDFLYNSSEYFAPQDTCKRQILKLVSCCRLHYTYFCSTRFPIQGCCFSGFRIVTSALIIAHLSNLRYSIAIESDKFLFFFTFLLILIYIPCLLLAILGPPNDPTDGVQLQPSVCLFRGPRTSSEASSK